MERKLRMEWDFWRPARCVKAADMQVAGCKVSGASIWYKACESKWLSWPIPWIPQLQVAFFWPDALCILLIHVGDSCGRVGCHLQEESGWIYVGFEYIWPLQTLVSRAKSDTMPVDPQIPPCLELVQLMGWPMEAGDSGYSSGQTKTGNALKLPGTCPWSHAPWMTCQAKICLMRRQHRWAPSVFSGSFARLLSFKNYCWDWFFGNMNMVTWTLQALKQKDGNGCTNPCSPPCIAEGGSAAKSQGCALDTVAFRGHRWKHQWPGTTWDRHHSDPEMQATKPWYDTIANLHYQEYIRIYYDTLTKTQIGDRSVKVR